MAVVAPSSAIPAKAPSPRLLCPSPSASSPPWRLNRVEKKKMMMTVTASARKSAFGVVNISHSQSTISTPRSLTVLASSKSKSQDEQDNHEPAFTFKEDLNYLLKLGGGSILGAIMIKYGSILLPEITRPNIVQALVMISSSVIVATLLLIKESRNQ